MDERTGMKPYKITIEQPDKTVTTIEYYDYSTISVLLTKTPENELVSVKFVEQ